MNIKIAYQAGVGTMVSSILQCLAVLLFTGSPVK